MTAAVVEVVPAFELATFEQERIPSLNTVFLDELPEFSFVERRARQIAYDIREERLEQLRQADFDSVPMPIDMTGTARKFLAAEREFGANSARAMIAETALDDDIDRQVGEIESKMTWGYFEPLTHVFSHELGGFVAYDTPLRDITANGISPMVDSENSERAINDFVHQNLDEAFFLSGYADDYVLFSIMECSDAMIDKYNADQSIGKTNGDYSGQVPEIQKMMIQCVSFDTNEGERYLEQAAIPGNVIQREDIHTLLTVLGVIQEGEMLDKIALHSKRIMVHKDIMDKVLDMQELLDRLASDRIGSSVFMGEVASDDNTLDYEAVPDEALRRSIAYDWLKKDIKQEMLSLERSGVDKWQTQTRMQQFISQRLFTIARHDPREARKVFNEATARGFERANRMEIMGMSDEAALLRADVERTAPTPSSCGPGSCGLNEVSTLNGDDLSAAKLLGIDVSKMKSSMTSYDKATCMNCGKKGKIYYVVDNSNAACLDCGTTRKNTLTKKLKNHKPIKNKDVK